MMSFDTPWRVTYDGAVIARFSDKYSALQYVSGIIQLDGKEHSLAYDAAPPVPQRPVTTPVEQPSTTPVAAVQPKAATE